MKLPHKSHVALLDGGNFSLLRNEGQIFEPRLVPEDQPELEPTNYSAGVRHQEQIGKLLGRTQLDELAHGAAAAAWLNARAIAGEIEALLIIADPKTLGEMRHHYHAELKKRLVGEIDKSFVGRPIEEIQKAIIAAE